MTNRFLHAWYYRLSYSDKTFSIFLNGQKVGDIQKPGRGRWPVYVTINERMYCYTKTASFRTTVQITDAINDAVVARFRLPLFSSLSPYVKFQYNGGATLVWEADNFFSLHWKWKADGNNILEAIDDLAGEKNSGVIAMAAFNADTDLLIATGFLLSLLKRSKLSMGMRGLKRNNAIPQ